jgi:hypothetical protein
MDWQKFSVWEAFVYGLKETINNIHIVICSILIIFAEVLTSIIVVGIPTITFAVWQIPELRSLIMRARLVLSSDGLEATHSLFKNAVISHVPLSVIVTCVCAICALCILWSMFTVGYIRMIMKFHDTGTAQLKEMFMGWHRGPRFLLATIIFTLAVILGLSLFIVPGLYILVHGNFYSLFIVDKNVGVFESFKRSFNAIHGYGWQITTLMLIGFLFKFNIITILVASFMRLLMNIYAYRRLTT